MNGIDERNDIVHREFSLIKVADNSSLDSVRRTIPYFVICFDSSVFVIFNFIESRHIYTVICTYLLQEFFL